MSNIKNVIIKAGIVLSLSLTAFAGIGTKITSENFNAISNELGQNSFEIKNKTDKMIYESEFDQLGGENGVIAAGKNLVKEIEAEGAVLLQNDNNALPLEKGSKVSLFGMTSINISVGGRGSAHASNPLPSTNLKDGLEMAGLDVNDDLYNYYNNVNKSSKAPVYRRTDMPFEKLPRDDKENVSIANNPEILDSIKNYGDSAIYIITRIGGEASDIQGSLKDDGTIASDGLKLMPNEKSILNGLADLKKKGTIKNIVVLLNSTNQIAQKEFLPEYGIDAMMWIGHVGITGTEAIGELLAGKQTPSGHLVDTFWYNHADNPVMKNYGAYKYTNRKSFDDQLLGDSSSDGYGTYVAYQEGIYLGYRYSETRYTDVVNNVANAGEFDYSKIISAPFGFGLSYTDFKFSDFNAVKDGDNYNVSVKITNTGSKYSGKDVAQIYLQKPYTAYDKENGVEKAAVELVGYAKTKVLAPGESQVVNVVVSEETFRTYDANKAKTYILSDGEYQLTAAHDSHQAANNFLAKAGKTIADGMTENGDASLVKGFDYEFDATKYATSRANGAATIKNLFDANNYNNIPGMKGKLEFRSRTNWNKELNNKLEMNQYMVDEINRQQNAKSIQKDTSEYPKYNAQNNLQLIQLLEDENGNKIAYDSELWDQFLDQLTWDETVDLISVGLRTTQAHIALGKPKTLDHNGPTGLTERYNKSSNGLAAIKGDKDGSSTPVYYPSIPVLAATYNKEIAKKFGNMLGEDALWAGYNGLYGIGLNTHRSPYAGRQFEYFSEDPFLAGTMATEEVKALQAKGCMAYIKHFALNDQETQRFGVQVWTNEQALREISLRPYEYAVIDGGAMNAMASFSRIGLEFAPASRNLMTNYLRGELGMKGLVVTDMYTLGYVQEQYPQFLMAGTDIPDGEIKPEVLNQFKSGYANVAWQMREAAKRIMYSTVHSNAMNGWDINTRVVRITPPWKVAVNSAMIGTSLLFAGFVIWGAVEITLFYKKKGRLGA